MFYWRFLALALMSVSLTSTALAGFTRVAAPTKGQPSQEQILDNIYGANFASAGWGFTSPTIQATRLQDFSRVRPQGMNEHDPASSDQVWADGSYVASVKARYAPLAGSVSFGYFSGASGGTYQKLFDVSGYGMNTTGSSGLVNGLGKDWRWGEYRTGPGGTNNYSSLQNDNGGKDHMVAYRITGLADEKKWSTWLLFWENTYGGKDNDFNDLVVEVKAAAMPAPGAVILGLVGLCLVGCYQRRRIDMPLPQ